MKIFGMTFGKSEGPMIQEVVDRQGNPMAYSTPFMKVGKGNLSLPQVNKYYTTNNIVMFGSDNLYPQLLNQMYYTSGIQGSIINFITNAIIGAKYNWLSEPKTAQEKVDIMTFEKKQKFNKLSRLLTRDYIIHRRVCVVIVRNNEGKLLRFKRLDPSSIRNYIGCNQFVFSEDWSRGLIDTKTFKRYNQGCKETETLYVYQDETPGQDIYPIPEYNSILNWCNLDGDIAYFHKANIENSVFPSAVIRRPKEFGSIEEVQKFKEEIGSKTGAGNGGRLLVLTGNGMDDVPEFEAIASNANDKLFTNTKKDLVESICYAHSINPSIMGIKVAGSLGNSEELQMSYAIFEKNVIIPFREVMEEILNDLVDVAQIANTLAINEFKIVDKVIEKVEAENKKIK